MAIALRGTPQVGVQSNGVDVTLTFDALDPAQEDDLVLLIGGHSNNGTDPFPAMGPVTAGYTEIIADGGASAGCGAWYKRMSATPDTTVVGEGAGNSRFVSVYGAYVFEGATVHADVIDTAGVSSGYQGTGPATSPAITTQTADALVVIGHISETNDSDSGLPSGYGNGLRGNANDSDPGTGNFGTKVIASPTTETPGSFTNLGTTGFEYTAITVAIKPAGGGGETAVEASQAVAFEALDTIEATSAPAFEALQGQLQTAAPPWEAEQGLAPIQASGYEALAGVQQTSAPGFEALAGVQRAEGPAWEADQAIAGSGSVGWEALAGVQQTQLVPWEAEGIEQTPVEASQAIGYEALAIVSAQQLAAWESLATAIATALAPYESELSIVATGAPAWESVQLIARSAPIEYESLRALFAELGIVWEAEGTPPAHYARFYGPTGFLPRFSGPTELSPRYRGPTTLTPVYED